MAVLHDKLKKQLKEENKRLKAQLSTFQVNDRGAIGYSSMAMLCRGCSSYGVLRRTLNALPFFLNKLSSGLGVAATGISFSWTKLIL